MRGWVFNATPRTLYPRERPGAHLIWGWVSPRADLDGCGIFCPHRDSIPGLSSPYRVSIPTELSRHTEKNRTVNHYKLTYSLNGHKIWSSSAVSLPCRVEDACIPKEHLGAKSAGVWAPRKAILAWQTEDNGADKEWYPGAPGRGMCGQAGNPTT